MNLSIWLSINLPIYLSIFLSIYLSSYLSTWLLNVYVDCIFAMYIYIYTYIHNTHTHRHCIRKPHHTRPGEASCMKFPPSDAPELHQEPRHGGFNNDFIWKSCSSCHPLVFHHHFEPFWGDLHVRQSHQRRSWSFISHETMAQPPSPKIPWYPMLPIAITLRMDQSSWKGSKNDDDSLIMFCDIL